MDDLPPEIAALIEQARRADDPSEVDQARVGRALATSLGLAPVGWTPAADASARLAASGAVATASTGTASVGPALKAALVVAAILASGAGAVFMWRGTTPAASTRSQQSVASSTVSAATNAVGAGRLPNRSSGLRITAAQPSGVSAAARAEAAPLLRTGARTGVVQAQPFADQASVIPDARSTDISTRSPIRSHHLATPTSPRMIRSTATQPGDNESTPPPTAAKPGSQRPTSAVHNRQTEKSSSNLLAQELSLISAASQALDSGDARAALRTLETHRRRFATGFLTEEREGLWAVALCQAGRVAEAASARADFERRAPRSPLRRRIETQCDR
jgi:hypothetical protein